VTGVNGAVSREQRRLIIRAASKHVADPARIRRRLERANRTGAREYSNLISEDCVVYSLDRYGRSHEETFGNSQTVASQVAGGFNLRKAIEPLLIEVFGKGNYSLVGTTGVTSASAQAPASPCQPVVAAGCGEYRLVAFALPQGQRATPRGIDMRGLAYGEGTPRRNGPSCPCVWLTPDRIEFLPHGGGYGGQVFDATPNGMLVGHTALESRSIRACSWSPAKGFELQISDCDGMYNSAKAVNVLGHVVGYTNISADQSGQLHHRPTSWPPRKQHSQHPAGLGWRLGEKPLQ
jgi:hypothetical protein